MMMMEKREKGRERGSVWSARRQPQTPMIIANYMRYCRRRERDLAISLVSATPLLAPSSIPFLAAASFIQIVCDCAVLIK